VLVDFPGRDKQFDFLVNTTISRDKIEEMLTKGIELAPDLILESDQSAPISVVNVSAEITEELSGSNSNLILRLTNGVAPDLWVHTSVPAPRGGAIPLVSVKRQDGKDLNPRNFWISKHSDTEERWLHILDFSSACKEYVLTFRVQPLDESPGVVTDLSACTVQFKMKHFYPQLC